MAHGQKNLLTKSKERFSAPRNNRSGNYDSTLRAIDLFSQPNHCAALTAQFFLDHLADVKFFHLKLHGRFVLKHDAKIVAWQKHLKKAVKKKIKIFQNKY